MSKTYPPLDLHYSQFQESVFEKFKDSVPEVLTFKQSKPKTKKELCFPKQFEYQLPQLFCKEFINPLTPYKSLLLFHKIGSGKTCAAIQIAEQWKDKRRVILATPASLKSNLYKEFRSECTGETYATKEERNTLKTLNPKSKEYQNLVRIINRRIDDVYHIYSHNKLISLLASNEINLNDSLLIIDEVQNIVSDTGSSYKTMKEAITRSPDSLRVVLLTATPIMDKPNELGLTMNLLKPLKEFPVGKEFDTIFISSNDYKIQNKDILLDYLNGYVSYYQGAPDKVFPLSNFRLVKVKMSNFQYSAYNEIKLEEQRTKVFKDNFFMKSRLASNIIANSPFTHNEVSQYSCKMARLLTKLKNARGTVFIYSNFKDYGGIRSIMTLLEQHGYKNFDKEGEGYKRFAIWSGDETSTYKDKILNIFNNKNNHMGTKIKILLGSPSIKEGVSLLRVRQVHILEPHWNMSRIQQIIGRAIRFCSHKDVKVNRRIVKVFLYLAVLPKSVKMQSIDEYILEMANKKEFIVGQFESILKESAIDRLLY